MSPKEIEELVFSCLEPMADELKFELADVEFLKEGQTWILRIFIDKEGGITIDDCEIFSRKAEVFLDKKDPITQAYVLEVSSPGIDRVLKKPKDFEKYKGETVDIKLYKALDKVKEFQGELVGLIDDHLVILDDKGEERKFYRLDVAICRLAVFF